jgi:hypothetical protein
MSSAGVGDAGSASVEIHPGSVSSSANGSVDVGTVTYATGVAVSAGFGVIVGDGSSIAEAVVEAAGVGEFAAYPPVGVLANDRVGHVEGGNRTGEAIGGSRVGVADEAGQVGIVEGGSRVGVAVGGSRRGP